MADYRQSKVEAREELLLVCKQIEFCFFGLKLGNKFSPAVHQNYKSKLINAHIFSSLSRTGFTEE